MQRLVVFVLLVALCVLCVCLAHAEQFQIKDGKMMKVVLVDD